MAGIDTNRERSIFEYKPKIERKIPKPSYPVEKVTISPRGAVRTERFNTLTRAIAVDQDIDETQNLIDTQLSGLNINVAPNPEIFWAVQQLGGTDTIDYDLYRKAQNLYRNASIASMCMDPAILVFAESSQDGPLIPRTKTRVVTCEEASSPDLFSPPPLSVLSDTIGMKTATSKFNQMSLYKTLQMTWWGMIIFSLHAILKMVESGIRAMKTKWNPVKLAIGRFLKKLAKLLRRLICWAEKKIFGKTLSGFCNQETTKDKSGSIDDPITIMDRSLCFELNEEDREEYGQAKECLDLEEREDSPEGEGCPVLIPQECIKAAHLIIDATMNWAIDSDDAFGEVNPAAILIDAALKNVTDLQETSKMFMRTSDNSSLTDKLDETTMKRPEARNRWMHPMVTSYVEQIKPRRQEYESNPSSNTPVDERTEECE